MTTTKRNGVEIVTTTKGGRKYNATAGSGNLPTLFRFESLADAGWIRITDVGEENVYFDWTDDDGAEHLGFCKCL